MSIDWLSIRMLGQAEHALKVAQRGLIHAGTCLAVNQADDGPGNCRIRQLSPLLIQHHLLPV